MKAMDTELRKKQRKKFVQRIGVYVGQKIDHMITSGDWTATEIFEKYGIPLNRQCEMKNPEKYGDNSGLNESLLSTGLQGGLFSVDEIKTNVPMTNQERLWLETKRVNEISAKLREAGYDPGLLLEQIYNEKVLKKSS